MKLLSLYVTVTLSTRAMTLSTEDKFKICVVDGIGTGDSNASLKSMSMSGFIITSVYFSNPCIKPNYFPPES